MERLTQALIGVLPRGPRLLEPATPESIASAKAHQQSERLQLAALGVVFTDIDGTGALAAVLLENL